jgi:hypothetical protein
MLSSILDLDLEKEVAEALKRIGHADLCLSVLERNLIMLMKDLKVFLKPFKMYTDAVSGCQPHLSLFYMTRHHIKTISAKSAQDHQSKQLKTKFEQH